MTTIAMPDIAWIDGTGFRPVIWSSHRHDEVDPQRPHVAPDADVAYLAKWDALTHPLTADGWALDPLPASLAGGAATPNRNGPDLPGWSPCCITALPGRPIVETPETPPQPAPVPLPASGWALVAAVALLASLRKAR